jgi:hypothetical protein
MKRLLALVAGVVLACATAGVTIAADGATTNADRILISIGGDIEVAAGDKADLVVVFDGDATVSGTVTTLVVANGTAATSSGAVLESITIFNGTVDLASGTTVSGDVNQLNSTVNRADGVAVGGSVNDLATDAAAFGLFLGAAAIVLWVGIAATTIVIGLLVAGLAARQVRLATGLISREPGKTFLVGLLAILLPPVLAVIAFVTIIGIPAALGLLLVLWPITAFIGYVIAAIWLGEWLLARGNRPAAQRPYLAAVVGLVVAFLLGFIPLVTAVISIFGLGAVVLGAWRTLRGGPLASTVPQPSPAAVA